MTVPMTVFDSVHDNGFDSPFTDLSNKHIIVS